MVVLFDSTGDERQSPTGMVFWLTKRHSTKRTNERNVSRFLRLWRGEREKNFVTVINARMEFSVGLSSTGHNLLLTPNHEHLT